MENKTQIEENESIFDFAETQGRGYDPPSSWNSSGFAGQPLLSSIHQEDIAQTQDSRFPRKLDSLVLRGVENRGLQTHLKVTIYKDHQLLNSADTIKL